MRYGIIAFLRRGTRSRFAFLMRLILLSILLFLCLSVSLTLLFRFVNPPLTLLMIKMAGNEHPDGRKYGIHQSWVKLEEISPNMILAVVASEDNRFLEHHGFDLKAMRESWEDYRSGKRLRGGSTISMQTAKNVFLWPGRNWLRKGFEAYYTVLIELLWGKKRIMEVYLNVIETGRGIYGVEAAAQHYYGRSAAKLSRAQSAMIAAILPAPRRRNPQKPTTFLAKRQQWIMWNMNNIERVDFSKAKQD
jgi:monofunctional biosynthetic peptidoglycan transglycosylase